MFTCCCPSIQSACWWANRGLINSQQMWLGIMVQNGQVLCVQVCVCVFRAFCTSYTLNLQSTRDNWTTNEEIKSCRHIREEAVKLRKEKMWTVQKGSKLISNLFQNTMNHHWYIFFTDSVINHTFYNMFISFRIFIFSVSFYGLLLQRLPAGIVVLFSHCMDLSFCQFVSMCTIDALRDV